jgi:hypothetical protein
MPQGGWIEREEFDRMLAAQQENFQDQQFMINEMHGNIVDICGGELPQDPDAP